MVSKEMLKSLQELREKAYEEKKLAAGNGKIEETTHKIYDYTVEVENGLLKEFSIQKAKGSTSISGLTTTTPTS